MRHLLYTIGSTKWMTLANSLLVYLINLWSTSLLNVTQASFDMSKPEVLNSEQGNARITLSEVLEYLDSIN